jgi:RecA/RadA recombinase
MATDYFKKFIDDLEEPEMVLASSGEAPGEFSGCIDSGSLTLNAALSGSLFGGIQNNKAIVLAGDPATGKTFVALGIAKAFLTMDKKARVFYFDTEAAITQAMLIERGIDPTHVSIVSPEDIQGFRNTTSKLLDAYKKLADKDRFPILIILDSLSMLPSRKEVTNIVEGNEAKDMTKPGEIKGTFRVLRLKMSKLHVPMVITNHVYANIGGYGTSKVVAGGSGAVYASDTIVMLSKRQDKVGDERVGSIIHAKMLKSRLSRESMEVDTRILYTGGLDRYYGILPLAEAAGLVKKVSNKYEFPDGTKVFESAINKDPEKYFTKDFLDKLEPYIQSHFKYTAKPTAEVEVPDDAD